MIRGVLCAGLLMVAAGCERKTEERIVKTDANELAKVMQLPVAPRAVKWVRATPGKGGPIGPNDATIVALLEFSDEGMKAMREKLDAAPDAEPVALNPPGSERDIWWRGYFYMATAGGKTGGCAG